MSVGEPIYVPNNIGFPRISPNGLIAAIFTFLAIAIFATAGRTYLRLKRVGKFELDDAFLLFALISLAAASGVVYQFNDLLYLQIYASLQLIPFPTDTDLLLRYDRLLQAASVLEWTAIFSAKFALLIFLRKLVNRLPKLDIWWKIILVTLIVFAGVCIPLGFVICRDFSPSFLQSCPPEAFEKRELVYTDASVTLDIVADALVLSIPLALIWKVKVDLRKKLVLAAVLCLSVFMIIIAIVRIAASRLPDDVTDTAWLFFWQTMEAAVAVITVSLTISKSLLKQNPPGSSSRGKILYGNEGQRNIHRHTTIRGPQNRIRTNSQELLSDIETRIRPSNQEKRGDIQELDFLDEDARVSHEPSVSPV